MYVHRKQYTTKPTDKAAAQTASNPEVRCTFASIASQPSQKALRAKGLRKGWRIEVDGGPFAPAASIAAISASVRAAI
jgi:hypothetical protein